VVYKHDTTNKSVVGLKPQHIFFSFSSEWFHYIIRCRIWIWNTRPTRVETLSGNKAGERYKYARKTSAHLKQYFYMNGNKMQNIEFIRIYHTSRVLPHYAKPVRVTGTSILTYVAMSKNWWIWCSEMIDRYRYNQFAKIWIIQRDEWHCWKWEKRKHMSALLPSHHTIKKESSFLYEKQKK